MNINTMDGEDAPNHTGLSPMMRAMKTTKGQLPPLDFNLDAADLEVRVDSSDTSSSPGTLTPSPAVSPCHSNGSSGRCSPESYGFSPPSSPSPILLNALPSSFGRRKRSSPSSSAMNRNHPPTISTQWGGDCSALEEFRTEIISHEVEKDITSSNIDNGADSAKTATISPRAAYKVVTCSSPGSTRSLKKAKGRAKPHPSSLSAHSFTPTSSSSSRSSSGSLRKNQPMPHNSNEDEKRIKRALFLLQGLRFSCGGPTCCSSSWDRGRSRKSQPSHRHR